MWPSDGAYHEWNKINLLCLLSWPVRLHKMLAILMGKSYQSLLKVEKVSRKEKAKVFLLPELLKCRIAERKFIV